MVIKCLCFDGVKNSENCTFRFRKLYVSFLRLYYITPRANNIHYFFDSHIGDVDYRFFLSNPLNLNVSSDSVGYSKS